MNAHDMTTMNMPTDNPAEEQPDFHGMLLFGKKTAFLYHLPMFMAPHFWQVYMQVTLTMPGGDPLAFYLDDRKKTATKMYSFAPGPFVLTDLIAPHSGKARLNSFTGNIWRGHFEDGHVEAKGKVILKGVTAHLTTLIHVQKLDPQTPLAPQLEYLLLGTREDLYLAHVVTRPPNFDQVVGVQVTGHTFTDAELGSGVRVRFPSRADTIPQKLREQEQIAGQLQLSGKSGPQTATVQIQVGTEFYFETADLARAM